MEPSGSVRSSIRQSRSTSSDDSLADGQSMSTLGARRHDSIWKKILLFIKNLQITVEPLMFILAACNTAKGICTPGLAHDKMTRVYPAPPELDPKELKKFYNKKIVLWDNNYQYVNLPIACIVGIMYGGYSDYHGRKLPLLVGVASVIIETAMRMLIWSEHTDWSLEWLWPTAVIAGLLGDFLMTMSAINAYVADQFENKKTLSIRMIIVSIMFSLGSFVASRFTKDILKHISRIALVGIAEGGYVLTLVFGILLMPNTLPKNRNTLIASHPDDLVGMNFWDITKLSFYSIYESARIFLINRQGHRRLFLWLCFLANFLDQFVFGEEKDLIGTYTLLDPFDWTTDQYADYKSWRPIVQIIGMFFGLIVLKKLFKLRDTFVICLAIGSMGLCVLVIGLAQSSWLIYASLAPGSLHGLLNPLTYTFMSCIVEMDEIGKAFAISSIAQKLAGFAQTAVLQNIYIDTVDWYQGFVWLLMSSVSFTAVVIYAIVHVVAKRENIGS